MKCINDTPCYKRAFYSVLKPELKKLRLNPIIHFLWVKSTSEGEGSTIQLDWIRHEHLEILFKDAEKEEDILVSHNYSGSLNYLVCTNHNRLGT